MLIAALNGKEPTVRFWCCYASGEMRARSAVSKLRKVALNDEGVCPGWWAVKDEAADAITIIQGGHPPDRVRVGESYALATGQ